MRILQAIYKLICSLLFLTPVLHVTIQAQTTHTELGSSRTESEEWGDVYGIKSDAIIDQSSVNLQLLPREYMNELVSISSLIDNLGSGNSPQCSGRVATLLQQCTKEKLSPESREEAALLLTLCDRAEIYPPPMECENIYELGYNTNKEQLKRCSFALDQHQNFQRTFDVYRILVIPEKCKSLNSIFNVDPSQELYRNITLEISTFLRSFMKKEMSNHEYFDKWDKLLNIFREATTELNTTKDSLANFNDDFVGQLSHLLQTTNDSLGKMQEQWLSSSTELASEIQGDLAVIVREHQAFLLSTLEALESNIFSGLESIFTSAQERQEKLDSLASKTTTLEHILGAANDLHFAREEMRELGAFIKDSTSKALNQVLLIDTKHHDLLKSVSSLTTDMITLSNTTLEMKTTLTDMHTSTDRRLNHMNTLWDGPTGTLLSLLKLINLSPIWAAVFLFFSLPRLLTDQFIKISYQIIAYLFSIVKGRFLSHRENSPFDDEKNMSKDRPHEAFHMDQDFLHLPPYQFNGSFARFSDLSSSGSTGVINSRVSGASVKTMKSSRLPSRLYKIERNEY